MLLIANVLMTRNKLNNDNSCIVEIKLEPDLMNLGYVAKLVTVRSNLNQRFKVKD